MTTSTQSRLLFLLKHMQENDGNSYSLLLCLLLVCKQQKVHHRRSVYSAESRLHTLITSSKVQLQSICYHTDHIKLQTHSIYCQTKRVPRQERHCWKIRTKHAATDRLWMEEIVVIANMVQLWQLKHLPPNKRASFLPVIVHLGWNQS